MILARCFCDFCGKEIPEPSFSVASGEIENHYCNRCAFIVGAVLGTADHGRMFSTMKAKIEGINVSFGEHNNNPVLRITITISSELPWEELREISGGAYLVDAIEGTLQFTLTSNCRLIGNND